MSSTKIRILYVEDYPVIQTIYTDTLRSAGFYVDAVNDGKLALAKIEERDYDMILLDLLLPQVSGVEFLREFSKKNKRSKVIVLTDFDKPHTVDEVTRLGVKEYWLKVENPPHVVARKLNEILKQK